MKYHNTVHVVINYISLGHHHVARLRAIADVMAAKGWQLTCLEAFAKDSDYAWDRYLPHIEGCRIKTVFNEDSKTARSLPDFNNRIRNALEEIKPTIMVVSGYALPESHAIRRWCRSNAVPLILLSDSQEKDQKRTFFKEFIKGILVSKHEAAFVAGESSAEYIVKLGIPADKVWKGSCVVDNDFWQKKCHEVIAESQKYRQQYHLPNKYILCISRFVSKKNLPFLVKAFCDFERDTRLAYSLVLVGDGPLKQDILDAIQPELTDHILLRPFQQADDLAVYYSLASCFVLPSSHNEQWGLVVNEAMASGLPVLVSSACGCAPDLVRTGFNGYTFDPQKVDDLVSCLRRVTDTEENRMEIGKNSLSLIDNYSCSWAAENLATAVGSVLGIPV